MGRELTTLLDKSVFFDGLSDKIKKSFLSAAQKKTFKKSQTIIQRAQVAKHLYLIIQGNVSIIRSNQDSDEILKLLGPLDVFGSGIIINREEGAKFEAKSDLSVLCWDKKTLNRLIKNNSELKRQLEVRSSVYKYAAQITTFIRKNSFMQNLTPPLINWLIDRSTLMYFSKESYICRDKFKGKHFYLLLKGQASVVKNKATVSTVYPGSCFGEMALIGKGKRTAHVIASEDCEVLALSKDNFNHLCKASKFFNHAMQTLVGQRVTENTRGYKNFEVIFLANATEHSLACLTDSLAHSLKKQFQVKILVVTTSKNPDFCRQKKHKAITTKYIPVNEVTPQRIDLLAKKLRVDFVIISSEKSDEKKINAQMKAALNIVVFFVPDARIDYPHPEMQVRFIHYAIVTSRKESFQGRTTRRGAVKIFMTDDDCQETQFSLSMDRLARQICRKTIGVALGGGGAWGIAHCALLQKLSDLGIPVDYVSGASFGSVVGSFYCSLGVAGLNELLRSQPELITIVTASLISPKAIGFYIDKKIPDKFVEDLATPFYPVAVNILNGREVVFSKGKLSDAVQASGSFPGVFGPTWINGKKYVDGGILNNVPVSALENEGADYVISSNVIPQPNRLMELKRKNAFYKIAKTHSPFQRFGDLIRSIYIMIKTSGEFQSQTGDFHFRPDLVDFLPMDFLKAQNIFEKAMKDLDNREKELKTSFQAFWKHKS
jgi:predicted acylesterase/phospholipase RssA/CRP-like cAMP-binding protein